jgi:hypothetical protein
MKKLTEIISFLSLLLVVLAPSLFYLDQISLELNKTLMLIATVAWFASSLCWMGRKRAD